MSRTGSRHLADSYWSLARSPLHCLVFLTPLLILYELGVLWFGGAYADRWRNGADFWMRGWLVEQGWEFPWLLPLLVVGSLLVWQIAGRFPWKIQFDTLIGMAAESLLFACLLVLFGHLQDLFFQQYLTPPRLNVLEPAALGTDWGRTISFVGAGIYEEVLFRLLALPLVYFLLRILLVPPNFALVVAVLSTSIGFSLAHYVGAGGDTFSLFSFVFRAVAGCLFCVLFVLRGFGITVGSHAAYDILVGVILRNGW